MPFPTATVTQGTGLTVNTLPNAGQATSANSLPVVVASDQSAVSVSAASLPLPSGAATAANQIGRTVAAIITPIVTSNGAYSAGNEIGGKMTFPVGGVGSGTLMSVTVTSKSVLTTALEAYVFSADPTNTTWTDRTAPAINKSDIASLLVPLSLSVPYSRLGTGTVWSIGGLGTQFVAANLYVILVAVSSATLTSASTADITVRLSIAVD